MRRREFVSAQARVFAEEGSPLGTAFRSLKTRWPARRLPTNFQVSNDSTFGTLPHEKGKNNRAGQIPRSEIG